MVQSDKEGAVTAVTVNATPAKFTSQLTSGYSRKKLSVYNNSNSSSGELYYGFAVGVNAASGQVIKKGETVPITVSTDLDIFFVAEAGEIGDLRVEENA